MKKYAQLNSLKIQNLSDPGRYADGNGLYLQISESGAKSWIFRYQLNGRSREMGLGSLKVTSLSEARAATMHNQKLLYNKIDPIEVRRAHLASQLEQASKSMTFDECASMFIEGHKLKWRNDKHISQWASTLKTYASPVIGALPIDSINTAMVLKVLEPMWASKTETASRVRGRIESVLDWAMVRQYRSGENPARWRGHLDKLLPKPSEVSRVKHHAALPFGEVGEFISQLRKLRGFAPRALEFLILTASRTGEVINATWDEIDLEKRIWTIPADRMKHKQEHRVPLSQSAHKILIDLKDNSDSVFIFQGWSGNRPLSNSSLLKVIKVDLGHSITSHGFRSTFRDWAAEYTNFSNEVIEMALAHTIGNKVEAAYRRGDLFLKRQVLMRDWDIFCHSDMKPVSRVLNPERVNYDKKRNAT